MQIELKVCYFPSHIQAIPWVSQWTSLGCLRYKLELLKHSPLKETNQRHMENVVEGGHTVLRSFRPTMWQ